MCFEKIRIVFCQILFNFICVGLLCLARFGISSNDVIRSDRRSLDDIDIVGDIPSGLHAVMVKLALTAHHMSHVARRQR